jgi:2'-5' RNA ligase
MQKSSKEIYNNFFVGVPVPKNIVKEYEKVTNALKAALPEIRINNINNLHITVLFIGQQEKKDAEDICVLVEKSTPLLRGQNIKIGGMGYYTNRYLDVMYLGIEENENLRQFYEVIRDDLSQYTKSPKRNFDPHLTLARVKMGKLERSPLHFTQESKDMLEKVHWEFPIKKINVYGRDAEFKNKPIVIRSFDV